MRSVTHCPSCQTQFFVTDEQLNQYGGKVRCGQCLHVFDATEQIIEVTESEKIPTESTDFEKSQHENHASSETTSLNDDVIQDVATDDVLIGDYHPTKFNGKCDDLADKSKLTSHLPKARRWQWLFFIFILVVIAISQLLYYLRNEIVIYYPNFKPYLVQACDQLRCKIELPKKIEFIVIDDSDIQEDAEHTGLIRLSSSLVNQASFSQAYPNLELTLTDTQDQPKLRRIFKPNEYLPTHIDITKGLAAGEEIKIKLAMNTQGEIVAGYRVFVTY